MVQYRDGLSYFIGVQIGALLRRETFNLYRSMTLNKVPLVRCTPDEISALVELKVIPAGIHSVTLVEYQAGSRYIEKQLNIKQRRKRPQPKPELRMELEEEYVIDILAHMRDAVAV